MSNEMLNKWSAQAWALQGPIDALRAPFHVLAGEAMDVAHFAKQNWDQGIDEAGNAVRPGLSSATGAGRFSDETATEIVELYQALQTAQVKYRLSVKSGKAAPVGRAQFAIREMHEVLRWYFDDGEQTDGDAQLQAVVKAYENVQSHDALAAALFEYAALADLHRTAITGLGGFDASLIEEAPELAQALRERSAGPATVEAPPEQRQALDLRNRIGMLLYDRMQRVRTAAQFVFRGHPGIVRQVTSAYARKQRTNHRRRQQEDGIETADTVAVGAVQPVASAPATEQPSGSAPVGFPGSNPFVTS